MRNTHESQILRSLVAIFLAAGIVTLVSSSALSVAAQASVAGQGSTVIREVSNDEVTISRARAQIPMAVVAQQKAEAQLLIGMLLVLAGFGFHALYSVRTRPIRTAKRRMRRSRVARPRRQLSPVLRRRTA